MTGALGAMVQQSNNTSNGVFITPAPPYPERPSATQNFAVNSSIFTEWGFTFPDSVGRDDRRQPELQHVRHAQHAQGEHPVRHDDAGEEAVRRAVHAARIAGQKTFDNDVPIYAQRQHGLRAAASLSQMIANNGTVDLTLKPEHAVQYEAGISGSWFNHRVTGQLTWFDLDNTDKLVSQTANAGDVHDQRRRAEESGRRSFARLARGRTTRTCGCRWFTRG